MLRSFLNMSNCSLLFRDRDKGHIDEGMVVVVVEELVVLVVPVAVVLLVCATEVVVEGNTVEAVVIVAGCRHSAE